MFKKTQEQMAQLHRMRNYIGGALGEGEHYLDVFTGPPTIVKVMDGGVYDGDQDYEVTVIHEFGGDNIPLQDIVDYVERFTQMVSDHHMPEATEEEYEALKASIAQHGVEYPVIVDENGGIIDGRLRRKACGELGIGYQTMVVAKLSLEQKRQLVLELNLCRRQVGLPAKKQIAKVLLRQTSFLSDRLIARQSGLDHKTVGVIRAELQTGGEIPHLNIREGKDKKRYSHPRITVNTPQNVERASLALQALGETAANKSMELRCAERKVRERKVEADRERSIEIPAQDDDFQLFHCGVQELDIPEGSVDLVMTDPPYPKEFLPVWEDLGKFAAKVLRPGGMLVTYTGHMYLDQVMTSLCRHLNYYWQFVLLHDGSRQSVHDRHVITLYKPILCYQKGPITAGRWIDDVLIGSGKEKSLHEWQQSVAEVSYCIERLSAPGSLIVDPFGGSFTTAEAVMRLGGRRFIGCDVDKACIVRGQERLAKLRKELSGSRTETKCSLKHTPPEEIGGE